MVMRLHQPATLLLFALVGCAEPPAVGKPREAMSERERDSTIAISGLPGASVVRKGLSISDVEARRAATFDSASKEN